MDIADFVKDKKAKDLLIDVSIALHQEQPFQDASYQIGEVLL